MLNIREAYDHLKWTKSSHQRPHKPRYVCFPTFSSVPLVAFVCLVFPLYIRISLII